MSTNRVLHFRLGVKALTLGAASVLAGALLALLIAVYSPSDSAAIQGGNVITTPVEGRSLGLYAAIDLDTNGYPVIAYFSGQLELLHCGNATCSSGNTNTPLPTGSFTFDLSMELDSAGNPVIAYYDFNSQTLNVLHCGNANCSAGNVTTVADFVGSVQGGDSISLALDAAGNAVVSYHDRTTKDLKVLRCGNPTCTTGNSIVIPDSAGDTGRSSSLVLDTVGNPIVAHLEISGGLKLLHCGDPMCSSGNTSMVVDALAGSGSLALDSTGVPVIAYARSFSAFDYELRILHCGSMSCTSGNTNAIGDNDDNTMSSSTSALALDSAGVPIVGYHANGTDGELRVLHCGDPTCAAGKPTPTPTPAIDFSLGIDIDGDTQDDCETAGGGPAACSIPMGSQFALKAYLNHLGPYAYNAFNEFVTYTGVASLNDPLSFWPNCVYETSNKPAPGEFFFSCHSGSAYAEFRYTGLMSTITFVCSGDGSVGLLHGNGKTSVEAPNQVFESGPDSLSIDCKPVSPVGGLALEPASSSGGFDGWLLIIGLASAGVIAAAGALGFMAMRREAPLNSA